MGNSDTGDGDGPARRTHPFDPQAHGEQLRSYYRALVDEPLPHEMRLLLDRLDAVEVRPLADIAPEADSGSPTAEKRNLAATGTYPTPPPDTSSASGGT